MCLQTTAGVGVCPTGAQHGEAEELWRRVAGEPGRRGTPWSTRQREQRMQGCTSPVMSSASSRRTALLPNTSDLGDLCCERPRTVKQCKANSRVGPRSRVQRDLPRGRDSRCGAPGSPCSPEGWLTLNNLTRPSQRLLLRFERIQQRHYGMKWRA